MTKAENDAYLPIESYGIIGDMHSAALVGTNGSIDWCCLPHFDSPSVFAKILDAKIGGYFSIAPLGESKQRQMYLPDSNILVTRSYTDSGLGQVEDFMPVARSADGSKQIHQIIRMVKCVRGQISYQVRCLPAGDFARATHTAVNQEHGVLFQTEGPFSFGLSSKAPLSIEGGEALGTLELKEGESVAVVFFCFPTGTVSPFDLLEDPISQFEFTHKYWQKWIAKCSYRGRWAEMVYRSALVLKLLTFAPTGAVVAAPTTALPEKIGGGRNWDYRYTWIRDASFTMYALMRIGYTEEAEAFMRWLEARCEEMNRSIQGKFNLFSWFANRPADAKGTDVPPLNLMYGIHGQHELPEIELDHLSGYRNSRPVRIGNSASTQFQLDIYGELVDAIYIYSRYRGPVSAKLWSNVRQIVDWVSQNWNREDEGIWETRGGRKHFLSSKLMCWVALDRATRMTLQLGLPGNTAVWLQERDRIYDQIMDRGWNEERKAFRHFYESDGLDASNLLMALVRFLPSTDPRMQSTIDATIKDLTRDYLVYRYDTGAFSDGLDGDEGTFSICTFWLVECLARAGRISEAHLVFQQMLSSANHLGLYAEEMGLSGEMLGNFPQAYTHLGFISAALYLNDALDRANEDDDEGVAKTPPGESHEL